MRKFTLEDVVILSVILSILPGCTASVGVGLLVGAYTGSPQIGSGVGLLCWTPLTFLAGLTFHYVLQKLLPLEEG